MGGQERGREGQRDIGQHIKFTAKSLNPLGGKVELREAKGSRVFATTQVKKKKKDVKNIGTFLLLQTYYFNHVIKSFANIRL